VTRVSVACQVGFLSDDGPFEIVTNDVLNLGVSPAMLVDRALRRFVEAGGVVRENTAVDSVSVMPDGVQLDISGGSK
jgi:hypothetical protein